MTDPKTKMSPPTGEHRPEITVGVAPAHPTVTGRGFLPGQGVTIRVLEPDDIVGYFRYSADANGTLEAPLPSTLPHGTLIISATDERPDTADDTGRLWTNTTTVDW